MFKAEQFTEMARTSCYLDADETVAGLLNGTIDPETVRETAEWIRQCFHRPRERELILHAVNAVLDGYGVEAIRSEDAWVDRYHGDIIATYVNFGDTYVETVVLDSESGEFLLTSWGDFLEGWEQEHAQEEEAWMP